MIKKQNENNTVVRHKMLNQVQHDMKKQVRNDNTQPLCHPEFISGSDNRRKYNISVNMLKLFQTLIVGKIPKQVRNDNTQPLCHPELVSGSNQLNMLWKTRHFSRNQEISEKVVKQVRNDNIRPLCHPELVSGSNQRTIMKQNGNNTVVRHKMLNQVQHDMKKQVRNDRNDKKERNSKMNIIKNIQKAVAFTLAETLVVMGIMV